MPAISPRSCVCLAFVPMLVAGCGSRPLAPPTAPVAWTVMLDQDYAREHAVFVQRHADLLRKLDAFEHPGRQQGEAVAVGVAVVVVVAIIIVAAACGGGGGGGGGSLNFSGASGGDQYPVSLIAIPVGGTEPIVVKRLDVGGNRFESPLPADCDVDISTEMGDQRWYVGRVHCRAGQEMAVAVTLAGPHLQAKAGGTFAEK